MGLRDRRPATTDAEHAAAVSSAELRLGRKLSTGEKRIDIVGLDRDLVAGKEALRAAIAAEQRRAAEELAQNGTPIQLRVTDAMRTAIADLYDAGAEHARAELAAAGVTVG